MKKIGVCFPEGFLSAGIACGIKKAGKKDLALVYSPYECVAAGTFTTNKVKAHSVLWSIKNIKNPINVILINSGNANAGSGKEGWDITKRLMEHLSYTLKLPSKNILFASTGLIGDILPENAIKNSLKVLADNLSDKNGMDAAESIITTDRLIKKAEVVTSIPGRKKNSHIRIGAMAKGSGMICPNMATMLAFITTDAVISRETLMTALKDAVNDSFNMINVDNDQSTNDTVFCLANGRAGNKCIKPDTKDFIVFHQSLKEICVSLAKMIAMDGEGSKKFIEVNVCGAWNKKDARRVAKKIAGSDLVKAAIAGGWPNWGRILAAAGSASARINLSKLRLKIGPYTVYDITPLPINEPDIKEYLSKNEITIWMELANGHESATAWSCDLTEEYVRINMKKE